MRVLVVLDDDATVVRAIEDALAVRGHQVTCAPTRDITDHVIETQFATSDLIVIDGEIAHATNFVPRLAAISPGIELLFIGTSGRPLPSDVMGQLERPVDVARLIGFVDVAADVLDGEHLREPIDLVAYETLFAGDSPQILNVLRRVRSVARSEAPVWIVGDDGSGRAIIAKAIHDRSTRRTAPFIAINAAAHSDGELAAALFDGETSGVQRAATGTVFLEQITLAGPVTQRALVKFLEHQPATKDVVPRARLVVGAQRPESAPLPPTAFLPELYYRLKVLEVDIPSLKDRARDLEQIAGRMLERLSNDGKRPTLAGEAVRLLERYAFPGNLLELAHALTHAFVVAHGGTIEPEHLPPSIRHQRDVARPISDGDGAADGDLQRLDAVAKRFERDYLLRVLRTVAGNRGRAAQILGLSRKGLWGKLKAHGISDDDLEDGASATD